VAELAHQVELVHERLGKRLRALVLGMQLLDGALGRLERAIVHDAKGAGAELVSIHDLRHEDGLVLLLDLDLLELGGTLG
jgi:hypothetical protein